MGNKNSPVLLLELLLLVVKLEVTRVTKVVSGAKLAE